MDAHANLLFSALKSIVNSIRLAQANRLLLCLIGKLQNNVTQRIST